MTVVPETELITFPINQCLHWQLVEHIHQDFRKSRHTDFLYAHQQQQKWTIWATPFKQSSMVLVSEDRLPSLQWQIRRIME
ncbi:hypothetical protein PR048_026778 [Dryococelus australis]|uniref:DUF5641 domain-containing protein n=1 Tax=Dryococelus australis TaxID=614101 RepID=A0ABQ9GMB6_9NEOP|nr:hypothetical protein PR048_026778 [Dryococelus australis]